MRLILHGDDLGDLDIAEVEYLVTHGFPVGREDPSVHFGSMSTKGLEDLPDGRRSVRRTSSHRSLEDSQSGIFVMASLPSTSTRVRTSLASSGRKRKESMAADGRSLKLLIAVAQASVIVRDDAPYRR